MASSTEITVLEKLNRMFLSSLNHPIQVSFRENAVKAFRYIESDQWTKEEKAVLEKRHQPATVNNQLKVIHDRVKGQFSLQKTRSSYRGRNSPQDEPGANVLTDLLLFIRQNNELEFEEDDVADDGLTCGLGVFDTHVTFDDTFQPEIRVESDDPLSIHPDPTSKRYDWNKDANFVGRSKWVDVTDAKELYPNKSAEISSLFSSEATEGLLGGVDDLKKDNFIDEGEKQIRLIEWEWKEKERETIILFPGGVILHVNDLILTGPDGAPEKIKTADVNRLKKKFPKHKEISRLTWKLNAAVFSANILFEHKKLAKKRFRWVPYFVYRKKSGEPYGLVHAPLTMQDAVNKRESKAISLLNENQSIYEQGVVTDKNQHAEQKALPDGQIELSRGGFEKFKLEKNLELAATQFQMHNAAKLAIREISGINPDSLGEKSEIRSGVGIARKTAQTDLIINPILNNFRRTKVSLAKNIHELIQNNYTEQKIFTITDDQNAAKQIAINVLGEDNTNVTKQAIYDVVEEPLPDTSTTDQESFQLLGQLLPQVLQFGPAWASFLIKISPLRKDKKDEAMQLIQQMSKPPPVEPKTSVNLQWSEMTPEEKSAFATKWGMESLAEHELKGGVGPAHIVNSETQMATTTMKVDSEDKKITVEEQKVAVEEAKVLLEDISKREDRANGERDSDSS